MTPRKITVKKYKCDECHDTGHIGDMGPGRAGNNEYVPCDCRRDKRSVATSMPSMPPQRRLRLALQETIAAEESSQEEMRGLKEKNGRLTHKLDQVEIHLKAIQSGKIDAKECTAFLLREFFPQGHNEA